MQKMTPRRSEDAVHGLWIGGKLGALDLLTLKSFVNHGHEFHLWVYDELVVDIPKQVIVEDAATIIPKEKVFRYPENSSIDWQAGKGSYAGFSDVFRYKLLFERGGWWVDMDITCLQPLVWEKPYFFRGHARLPLVGNIMKVPQHSALMSQCYERAAAEIDENNEEWHKPIQILCDSVLEHHLGRYIQYGWGSVDHASELRLYIKETYQFPEAWHYVHWMNSWMHSKFGDRAYVEGSGLHRLLVQYNLLGAEC